MFIKYLARHIISPYHSDHKKAYCAKNMVICGMIENIFLRKSVHKSKSITFQKSQYHVKYHFIYLYQNIISYTHVKHHFIFPYQNIISYFHIKISFHISMSKYQNIFSSAGPLSTGYYYCPLW